MIEGHPQKLFVRRKGATRAYSLGHPDLPTHCARRTNRHSLAAPWGTASYVLMGASQGETCSLKLLMS